MICFLTNVELWVLSKVILPKRTAKFNEGLPAKKKMNMLSTTAASPSKNDNIISKREGYAEAVSKSQAKITGMPSIKMPYKTRLSFAPLLRHWQEKVNSEDIAGRLLAREIMERAMKMPQIWEPFDDYAELENYRETIDLLLAGLFPLALRNTQLGKAGKPFDMESFFMTPAVEHMMRGCSVNVRLEKQDEFMFNTVILKVCSTILNACYGQKLDVDPLIVFTMEPEGAGISYHFKSLLNSQFIEVVPVKPLKKLSQEQIHKLISNIYDLDAWMDALPPENFEIHGVFGMNLIDVTKEETISRLRFQLLGKDAVVKKENIRHLETLLKTYFGIPGLRLGIMAMDYPADRSNEFKYKIRHCFLADRKDCLMNPETVNSVYDKAMRYREVLLVEDLEKLSGKTLIEQDLLKSGLRSYLVAPLFSQDEKIIGLIELGTPNPYELTSFTEQDFKSMLPLFNIAVERSREETDNKIEAIIREQFTAIHPSVEWRFIEAAFNYLDRLDTAGKQVVAEPIVFDDVYPLYAQADIVSSSNTRNQAIQEDFSINLQLIRDILSVAAQRVDFPLLDHYLLETEHRIEELKKDLKSSDESQVIDFILHEIHPLLEEAARHDASVALALNIYQSQLDPNFGVVYQKRKDYEESVTLINTAISDYLEREDERTQKMIPHYFEKYKTDGVQFELYAGQSILKNGRFSNLHLRNLRLWQLTAMCEITRNMEKLKNELPIPLCTAQLVFVYGQPISIRFRMDDKRFDVDGAYNIRYEIIKKRIDKATVTTPDGKTERLTQADKIAIVYASEKDREEYLDYLTFLRRQGFIEDAVEELELGQLQGVQGLKALRVTVK